MRPTRALFLHRHDLGWRTYATHLARYADRESLLSSTHVARRTTLWDKLLTRRWPVIGWRFADAERREAQSIRVAVERRIRDREFDVVFCAGQGTAAAVADACGHAGARLVTSLDVTGPLYARDLNREPATSRHDWSAERNVYERSDLIVPWSSWAATSLTQDFGVAPAKVVVVPPAVAVSPLVARPRTADGPVRLVFVGNDWERKGGPRLLRWFRERWSTRCELHVLSAKSGRLAGVRGVVRYGRLPHAEVTGCILPRCDVFVMPTRLDMSPFAIAEAQAAGLPCVSSRLAGIPDLIVDGRTGFLANIDDDLGFQLAVEQLVDDVELREQMSTAAHAHATRHLDADHVYPSLIKRLLTLDSRRS